MQPNRKQQETATKRFKWIMRAMVVVGVCILGRGFYTMAFDSAYWLAVGQRFTKADITIPAHRGELLDCNGRTMVTSVPEYQLYLDLVVIDKDSLARARTQHFRDSALVVDKDSICRGLARIFPDHTADYYRHRIDRCLRERRKNVRLYPRQASYIQYRQCQQLPLLRESTLKGGFHGDAIMMRKKPYGSLASRTVGTLENVGDTLSRAKNGLEECYDSVLRGVDGIKHRAKVRDRRVDFVDREPQDGRDLVTTIDVNIQDMAEKAIVAQMKKMKEQSGATADLGMVIVMEAATGDVKALVNMALCDDGNYYEVRNNALADRLEPGSTFKTASIMAAIEDGRLTKDTEVETGNGTKMMYGRRMSDAGHVGYGRITVKKVMQKSSNVGVSTLIDNAYHNDPEKYVASIKREGMGIPLNLPIKGAVNPLLKDPKSDDWYRTTLPWMSIGYETLLPPINTVTFYNGIANGGRMVKPRFVKAEMENGRVVKEYPVVTLREQMCSKNTLDQIHEILESVVSGERATGNRAQCPQFHCSGKTGTAQIAGNAKDGGGKGYGTGWHLVSFVGYFPSEAPKYTCQVSIKVVGPAGGGISCGPVFSQVAQNIMANGLYRAPYLASDSASVFTPFVWNGNVAETADVLRRFGVTFDNQCGTTARYQWGRVGDGQREHRHIALTALTTERGTVPDVTGMGARDAVYALQALGLKVRLKGAGHVETQSLPAGAKIRKGQTITLVMG